MLIRPCALRGILILLLLLAMKYTTLVSVFSYNVKRGVECGCGNSGQTVIELDAS